MPEKDQVTEQSLEYHGRQMNAEPINIDLGTVADKLRGGSPVVVQLEPGDGTHYCLLVVPAWADDVRNHLDRFGIRPHSAESYMIVTQLDDTGGHGFYAFADGVEEWDLKHIHNDWTRAVFCWWFNLLWPKIRA